MIKIKALYFLGSNPDKILLKVVSRIDSFADSETEITLQSIIDLGGTRLMDRFFAAMRLLSVYGESALPANQTKALMSQLAVEEFKKIDDYHAIDFLEQTIQSVRDQKDHISATMYQHELIKLNDLIREEMLHPADGKTGDARFSLLRSIKMMLYSSKYLVRQYFEAEMCINLCSKILQIRNNVPDDKIKTFDFYVDVFQQSILDKTKEF